MRFLSGGLASLLIVVASLFSIEASAQQPARFNFVFEDPSSSARAEGYIVFDLEQLPNPGDTGFVPLPDPLVIDLQVTVTGSAAGDGTFNLADFNEVIWSTGGVALDLSPGLQVVGQPTSGGTWGPNGCGQPGPEGKGSCGDFNILSGSQAPESDDSYAGRGGGGVAPNGIGPFRLAANGGTGEVMELTSFIRGAPEPTSVPTLSATSTALFAALLLAIGWVAIRLRA
jgi:hypothetical protein